MNNVADVFHLMTGEAVEEDSAALLLPDDEAIEGIGFFYSLSTGNEYVQNITVTKADLESGEVYGKVMAAWGRLVNYNTLRFDKLVARFDASVILATWTGLNRYAEASEEMALDEVDEGDLYDGAAE